MIKRIVSRLSRTLLRGVIIATFLPIVPAFGAADFCDRALQRIVQEVDDVETLVPNVPPEEADYLEKEYYAATSAGSQGRFAILQARPYYYAWRLHVELEDVRDTLNDLERAPAAAKARTRIESASDLPGPLGGALEAWLDYVRAHGNLLTEQQLVNGGTNIRMTLLDSGQYIRCEAEQLPLKE